ncbi:MAG TPA: MFS transporter, partial [Steroidobacteraceae bacterium]|nr:MFS transporter [Steroidobacteraceae bacterium]
AEAGFFPGVVYYLTQWAPARERARLIGLFMTAIPISTALGGPLSGAILHLDGVGGIAGWRWLYALETVPSLVLGFVALAHLPDTPAQARWLAPQEKDWLLRTLAAETTFREAKYGSRLGATLADPRVLTLCLAYFGVEIGLYGVILWLPQIFKAAGVPHQMVGFAVAIPYTAAAVAMVWWAGTPIARTSGCGMSRGLHWLDVSASGLAPICQARRSCQWPPSPWVRSARSRSCQFSGHCRRRD